MEKIHNNPIHPYIKAGLMMLGYGIMLLFAGVDLNIYGYGLRENISMPFSLAGFVLLGIGIFGTRRLNVKQLAFAALGLLYISLSWGMMLQLNAGISVAYPGIHLSWPGNFIPLIIILSIWVNDTMAYIVGSFIGKRPLSKISPKKTWEGTIGGIILSIAVITLVVPFFYGTHSFESPELTKMLILISSISAIVGTFGDLLESKLKRMAGVKDSGTMMPGHGGFLDRFDSMLLATPFVWFAVSFMIDLVMLS
jgi:phosphatidate cytidylyltransferase